MEHELERLTFGHVRVEDGMHRAALHTVPHALLDLMEQAGAQLDHARLVCAVHIAERERRHVPAALAQSERVGHFDAIFDRGIQLFVDFRAMAVLFAAHRADLDFEHGVRLHGLVEQPARDLDVLVQRHGRTVPHVRLEHRLTAVFDFVDLDVEQRLDPFAQVLLGAVVGVQGHGDVRVFARHLVRERGEGKRTGHTVCHTLAGEIGGAADRHLDDAVRSGVREPLQSRIERLAACHIDRGVRVTAAAGGIEHLGISFRRCNSHTHHYPARHRRPCVKTRPERGIVAYITPIVKSGARTCI